VSGTGIIVRALPVTGQKATGSGARSIEDLDHFDETYLVCGSAQLISATGTAGGADHVSFLELQQKLREIVGWNNGFPGQISSQECLAGFRSGQLHQSAKCIFSRGREHDKMFAR